MGSRKSIIISKVLAITFIAWFVLAGCATRGMKHTREHAVPVDYDICVAEGVRIAAQAMQRVGFWVTKQNDAAGYLYGERKERFIGTSGTYYLEVNIGRPPGAALTVRATSIAGPEIAFTTDLPGIVKDFHKAFDEILGARHARLPERKPAMSTPEAPEKGAVPDQKPSTKPAAHEYDL